MSDTTLSPIPESTSLTFGLDELATTLVQRRKQHWTAIRNKLQEEMRACMSLNGLARERLDALADAQLRAFTSDGKLHETLAKGLGLVDVHVRSASPYSGDGRPALLVTMTGDYARPAAELQGCSICPVSAHVVFTVKQPPTPEILKAADELCALSKQLNAVSERLAAVRKHLDTAPEWRDAAVAAIVESRMAQRPDAKAMLDAFDLHLEDETHLTRLLLG